MHLSLNRFQRSKSTESDPHSREISKPRITLKTILKSRENPKQRIIQQDKNTSDLQKKIKLTQNQQEEDSKPRDTQRLQKVNLTHRKNNQYSDHRMKGSKSLQIANVETLPELKGRNKSTKSIKANVFKKLESMIPQSNTSYAELMQKLNQLDAEAEALIRKKILKLSKKSALITLKTKGKDEISIQIEKLVWKIKNLQSDHLQKMNINPADVRAFTDKKIKILEKLLAQNETEKQVLKKYFFAISAINQQNKSALDLSKTSSYSTPTNKRVTLHVTKSYDLPKNEPQPICNQSSNQLEYHSPKPNEYETYRYKAKDYAANNQPFPRSSYNRDFLINPKTINFNCKNMDNHTSFGRSRFSSSTYSKDFQRVHTEIVDFRELDSYRNKFKKIQINFNYQNKKQEAQKYVQKSRKYIEEQLKMRYNQKIPQVQVELPLQVSKISISNSLVTENKRVFTGEPQFEHSVIKNKGLSDLKYSYKSLINN